MPVNMDGIIQMLNTPPGQQTPWCTECHNEPVVERGFNPGGRDLCQYCLIRRLRSLIRRLRSQVVFGCYENEWPVYHQGYESGYRELTYRVTAEDMTRLVESIKTLNEENGFLRQAVGLLTTLKPCMVVRTDDPMGMAREVVDYIQSSRSTGTEVPVDSGFPRNNSLIGNQF